MPSYYTDVPLAPATRYIELPPDDAYHGFATPPATPPSHTSSPIPNPVLCSPAYVYHVTQDPRTLSSSSSPLRPYLHQQASFPPCNSLYLQYHTSFNQRVILPIDQVQCITVLHLFSHLHSHFMSLVSPEEWRTIPYQWKTSLKEACMKRGDTNIRKVDMLGGRMTLRGFVGLCGSTPVWILQFS